ncbi:MAG: cryptochrome/photolyase family protein [Betaproteobacteria bacterium]|nr:cryptochrome/photolyase family protein [Betaproteobacteria bacterium]
MSGDRIRDLVVVLGDQLDVHSSALDGAGPADDMVWMAEVQEESTHVWSSKPRTAFFLAAMRHFAEALRAQGWRVEYARLGTHAHASVGAALDAGIARHQPHRVVMTEAGDWRVENAIKAACARAGVPLDIRADAHFFATRAEFAVWARGKEVLRMEMFYRTMRVRHGVLVDANGDPEGGRWNFDEDNRGAFGTQGPGTVPPPLRVDPDALTREALADVETHFAPHPGSLKDFHWPVTRADALRALNCFVADRLPHFGRVQDAMWTGEAFLFHSHLSAALNVKLLNPREVVRAAIHAYSTGHAPLAAVEGFVRQILGWREFVRGVYWLDMPGLREANHYGHARALPAWYWTGDTHMRCMREAIGQTLRFGYAHHIQRLMVTGIFGLMAEIDPRAVADWYLAVYVDAVEWAELPNVAGMALHADGGRMTSKPYIASGQYIKRMSNYCSGCRYRPEVKTGPRACPVTTLYWNFVDRHEETLSRNPRTALMAKSVQRLSIDERAAIQDAAAQVQENLDQM